MYVVRIPWPRPQTTDVSFLRTVVDADVASKFIPPIYEAQGRYVTPKGAELDVRNVPQPSFAWVNYVQQQTTSAQLPAIPVPYRVGAAPQLDVRSISQPAFTWVQPLIDREVATRFIPPIYEALQRIRTPDAPKLDVANVPQPSFAWVSYVTQSVISSAFWPPIEQSLKNSYRTPEAPVLDVRNVPQPPFVWGAFFTVPIRTTQIVAEIVIRPQQQIVIVGVPPPAYFDTSFVLQKLTGPARPMEICSGYLGTPAVLSQLIQVRAHYTFHLAPVSSLLRPFHTPQVGTKTKQEPPAVKGLKNTWFHIRQTDRYHRICLVCDGDTEITGLTWTFREGGIR